LPEVKKRRPPLEGAEEMEAAKKTGIRPSIIKTHEVVNQPPPLGEYNCYLSDPALREGVQRGGASWNEDSISAMGEKAGSFDFQETGRLAQDHIPELKMHDRFGRRTDDLCFHPAYHEVMRTGVAAEVHALPWNHEHRGAHVARAAKHYLFSQAEPGPGCPLTMTFASVPCIRLQPEIAEVWLPRICSTDYDDRMIPASEKTGCQIGMAMTEKQGGSDVRANLTVATPAAGPGPGNEYLLTGHKWFVSGTLADAFLCTALTGGQVSCFFVPRFLPDGTKNNFFIQRIKDKLGNRSNATSEIEFLDTHGWMVGEESRGIRNIMEMVTHTRLDCSIGTAAIMRNALAQAIHHATHRHAFGKALIDQPLMANVLADIALESEAATTMMMRLASFYDDAREDAAKRPLMRIATAVTKYWICKRAPNMVYEALECHGGDGYIEEGPMPRLYREAPVSSVWEGSGNVICLDVLKTLQKEPEALPMLLAELESASGENSSYDAWLDALKKDLAQPEDAECRARRLMERLGKAFQASLLLQFAPAEVSAAFCLSRLAQHDFREYGGLPPATPFRKIIDRAFIPPL
jgi:putative acyl-CoA dehydrogenase